MARYDYRCKKCGNVQDEFHLMVGPSKPIKCAKCNSKRMEKMVSSSYIKFEGPGWQTNDDRGICKPLGAPDMDSSGFMD